MTETAWRSTGGLLQLAGVVLVFVGVYRTRRQLPGFVGFKRRMARLWRRIARKKGESVVVAAFPVHARASVHATDAIASDWDQLDDSARIERLRKDIKKLGERINETNQKLKERFRTLEDRVRKSEQKTSARLTALEEKVHAFAGDNLRLEAIGAVCFFVGIALTTWAPELTGWTTSWFAT